MRIVHLVSGAGDMYCGSCLQSNTLAAALRAAGEDVVLVPAYTPLRTDEENLSADRMVLGGLNVYLQQQSALFRHTPRFLDRLLDRPGLLRWLGRRSATVRPEGLGELCLSMLRGEDGRQRKEVDKLIDWFARDLRPEVVHLSNVLLAGLARPIHQRLGIPVIASLSGEDLFLDGLPEPYRSECRAVLHQRCQDLAALVAPNRYFADHMSGFLGVTPDRVHVIASGLSLVGHLTPVVGSVGPTRLEGRAGPRTIGYLARVCADKGLHLLAEAMEHLVEDRRLPPVRVLVAGYLSPADRPYLAKIEDRLRRQGLADRFQYVGELSREEKIAFLQSLDVKALPTVYRESKGIPVLEAWANGVPVVVPAHGAFPELVRDTGGGLLCRPNDAVSLAEALAELLLDPVRAACLGRQAQEAVHGRYHAGLMAERTATLYRSLAAPMRG